MAVRNFYVEADIDGRQTMLGGGPRNKEDGMKVCIYQRVDGAISDPIKIICTEHDGVLTTEIFDPKGKKIYSFSSPR